MIMAVHEAAAREFDTQRDFLWGLCYRMTGSTADADALVQETFVRVLERPAADLADGWRPWLARVAAALSMDALRLRQRREYAGPWLPAPAETGDAASGIAAPHADLDRSYDDVESLTFQFLLAAEMLTPRQRAVLVLRAVYRYSVADAAQALDLTYATVRSTLQQAFHGMDGYEAVRARPTRDAQSRMAALLHDLLTRLQRYDTAGVESMLAPSARALSDGGGEFVAPAAPVIGRDKIVRLLMKLADRRGPPTRDSFRMLNGLPALVAEVAAPAGWAQRFVFRIDVDADGRVSDLHTILATRKLTAVRFEPT